MNKNKTKRTEILDPKFSLGPQAGSELKIDSIFIENEDNLNNEMTHIQTFSQTLEGAMLWCNSREFMRIMNSGEIFEKANKVKQLIESAEDLSDVDMVIFSLCFTYTRHSYLKSL